MAHASTPPNRIIPPRSPLAHKCATAQSFTPTSIGVEHPFDMSGNVGGDPAMLAGHIATTAMWRAHAGGYQSGISLGPITRETETEQYETDNGNDREQPKIGAAADARYQGVTAIAQRNKHMRAEKNDQAENFEREPHGAGIITRREPLSMWRDCPTGGVATRLDPKSVGKSPSHWRYGGPPKRKLMPALISAAFKLALDAYVDGVAVVKFGDCEPNER